MRLLVRDGPTTGDERLEFLLFVRCQSDTVLLGSIVIPPPFNRMIEPLGGICPFRPSFQQCSTTSHADQFSVYGGQSILDGPIDFSSHSSVQFLAYPLPGFSPGPASSGSPQ